MLTHIRLEIRFWSELLLLSIVLGLCMKAAPDIPIIFWGITAMVGVVLVCVCRESSA